MSWVDNAITSCPEVTRAQKRLLESTMNEMLELLVQRTRGEIDSTIIGLVEEGCMEARAIIDCLRVRE